MEIKVNECAGKDSIRYGKVVTFDMTMDIFPDKRTRTIRVWLPAGYDGMRRFPVLYMHDAQNLFEGCDVGSREKWCINQEMETLEKEGLPAIIVGIDTAPTRFEELCPPISTNPDVYDMFGLSGTFVPNGDLYAGFITGQLKTYVDTRFLTLTEQANTAVGGASMGGLISLYILLKYPSVFSKAMVFAPNFMIHYEFDMLSKLALYDFRTLLEHRIFIFHGGLTIDALNWPFTQKIYETMRDKGMDDTHLALLYDSRQPHYESAWRKYFAEAFRYLFLEDNATVKS